MRHALVLAAALLAACGSRPDSAPVKQDPTKEAWYGEALQQLQVLNREAENQLRAGKPDRGAALITQGQPLMNRLLAVPKPTLEAMEAASDLDDLYGRMLLANRHYGWARLQFQRNAARWKNWAPQTPETERRRKLAESAIAECDRQLAK